MSGSSKTTSDTQTSGSNTGQSTTNPWAPQAAGLTNAFNQAGTALGTAQGATAPTDFTAQMTPDQLANFNRMVQYGTNTTSGTAAAGGDLTSAGVAGATGALTGLSNYDPTQLNNTGSITDAATAYANNPAIDGMIKAAMRDANQSTRDVVLPGIDSAAANSGNTNSSRTGIAQGLVERALAQQTADTSATIRGNAYNQGLTLAQEQAQNNNAAKLAALTGAGSLGGSLASTGIGATSQSIADQKSLFDIANGGGAGQQAATQLNLDNQGQQYASKTTAPFDALEQYMKIIGSNNWGGSTTSSGTQTGTSNTTGTATPSAWQVIGGLMSSAGSLAKGFTGGA